MSTIFVSTAIKAIKITIMMARDASRDADKSAWGFLRNSICSREKQAEAETYLNHFAQSPAFNETGEDLQDYLALKENLHLFAEKIFQLGLAENGEGNFGQHLAIANQVLDDLFFLMKKSKWLNIPVEKTAYTQLILHASEYELLKVIEVNRAKILKHNRSDAALTEAKRETLQKGVKACAEEIDGLDAERDDYPQRVVKVVKDSIERICASNKELVKEKSIAPEIGLFKFAFMSLEWHTPGVIGPGMGDLYNCMVAAKTKINELNPNSSISLAAKSESALNH